MCVGLEHDWFIDIKNENTIKGYCKTLAYFTTKTIIPLCQLNALRVPFITEKM